MALAYARDPNGNLVGVKCDVDGFLLTEPLARLGRPDTLSVTAASATFALQPTTTRVSLVALGGDVRIRIYTGVDQAAVTTDHILMDRERIDVRCLAGSKISAVRAGTTDCSLSVSELL